MKTIKPQQLSLLTRTFENEGRTYLVLSALAAVDLDDTSRLAHEASFWKMAAETLGPSPLDEAMSKIHGEVLVAGSAFAKEGAPAAAVSVRVKIASVDKELYVVGNRRWETTGMSSPAPFTDMPVTWERAFGGPGVDLNPGGRGSKPIEHGGVTTHALPNVEDPKRLIKNKGDRPEPAGFGPIDVASPLRTKKAGTYDDLWLKTRYPDFAADFDWTFFNVAPSGQQIEGYFVGDETFEIHGMHPTARTIKGKLPGLAARIIVITKPEPGGDPDAPQGEPVTREAETRLDTVFFFPNAKRAILVYRGVLEVADDDLHDVDTVIAAFEDAQTKRSLDYYLSVREKRSNKKYGALLGLKDGDLLPSSVTFEGPLEASDTGAMAQTERLMYKRMTKKVDIELARARKQAIDAGLDPAEVAAKFPERVEPAQVPSDPDELVELIESSLESAHAHRDNALAEMRVELEAMRTKLGERGVAVDVEELLQGKGGPPELSADKQLEQIRSIAELRRNAGMLTADEEARFFGPELEASLRDAERRVFDAYRRFGHFWPAAKALDVESNGALRDIVEKACREGDSLEGRDLTGADLSGMSLRGADLSKALLESVDFRGASLRGANLEGALLARANLEGVDLDGARMRGANFGRAKLTSASFGEGADLAGAVFYETNLSGASLVGAKLDGTQFLDTRFSGARLAGVSAPRALFMNVDLSETNLDGANLSEAILLDCKLDGASFVSAVLTGVTIVRTRGAKVDFSGANLEGARIVFDTALPEADFRGARFKRTCMRTTNFNGADFSGAEMPEVDLSECDLRNTKFYKTNMVNSLFIRSDFGQATLMSANLMNGILQKARLAGTDLRGANLFRADMAKAKGDDATQLDDAYRVQVRIVPEKRRAP